MEAVDIGATDRTGPAGDAVAGAGRVYLHIDLRARSLQRTDALLEHRALVRRQIGQGRRRLHDRRACGISEFHHVHVLMLVVFEHHEASLLHAEQGADVAVIRAHMLAAAFYARHRQNIEVPRRFVIRADIRPGGSRNGGGDGERKGETTVHGAAPNDPSMGICSKR